MKIKIPVNGIYKRIPENVKSSVQLNDLLSEQFGEKNIFADFSVANGHYIWTMPGDDWHKLSSADEETAERVRHAVESMNAAVGKVLSSSSALSAEQIKQILSVPSDDYIYYNEDSLGNVSVKLVAWDYQLPSRQISDGGHFKVPADVPKQDISLCFVEAGKPVKGYTFLIKGQGGRYVEKQADGLGIFNLPRMPIGKDVAVFSSDKTRDFSFTVTAGKSEYVYDLTGPVRFAVKVFKDGDPCPSSRVRLIYSGQEFESYTDSCGIAECDAVFHENAEVTAVIDGNTATRHVEYPVTEIGFDLRSPVAEVTVICTKNGNPFVGETVVINVSGFETAVKTTRADGTVVWQSRFHEGAELSVSAGGDIQRKPMALSNEFRFDFSVPEPVVEYYNVFLKCNNEKFPENMKVSLRQGSKLIPLNPDSDGLCRIEKDAIECGRDTVVSINLGNRGIGQVNMAFSRDEDDYELNVNLKKRIYVWDIIKQMIVAIGTAFFFGAVLLFLIGIL